MKRKLLFFTYLIFISLVTIGCASNESKGTAPDENSSIVKEAIDKGKLALADSDIEKAKSNFNLALMEDSENVEAKEWVELIEKYDHFISEVDEQEPDKAEKTLNELKKDDKYELIEPLTKDAEQKLNTHVEAIEELDLKIAALSDLYDPEDENSMPSEDYLYLINEILTNPNITEKQKKFVEDFEEDATDRANSILAKMEEEMRAAEEEAAQPEGVSGESISNVISAEEAADLAKRLPSYPDLVANGDTFADPRIFEDSWIIDISRPNGLAEGSIIVNQNTISFMYPNGDVDEVTPY